MEIKLAITYDELSEDGSRSSDGLVRAVAQRFPDAVWERYNAGWRITV